jgi:3D (Asp-Asp-Asp) domain-containing protein
MINVKKKGNKGENAFANWLYSHGFKAWRNGSSGSGLYKGDINNMPKDEWLMVIHSEDWIHLMKNQREESKVGSAALGLVLGIALASLPLIPLKIEYQRVEVPHYAIKAQVTAYTSSPDETWGDPYITASGMRTGHGVAACPERLKFGTVIEIAGQKYTCLDRMNARYRDGDYFDIWMPEKHLAYEWGRRNLEIKVYER